MACIDSKASSEAVLLIGGPRSIVTFPRLSARMEKEQVCCRELLGTGRSRHSQGLPSSPSRDTLRFKLAYGSTWVQWVRLWTS